VPATEYDIKNKVIAYMAAVYVTIDVIWRQQLAKELEMRLASEPSK